MSNWRKQLSIGFQLHQTRHHLKNCSCGDVVCNFLHSMVKSAPEGISLLRTGCERRWREWTNFMKFKGCPKYFFLLYPTDGLICDVHVWNFPTSYIHLPKHLYIVLYYVINSLSWAPLTQVSMNFILQHLWTEPGPSPILSAKPKGSSRFGELRALRSPGALLRVCLPGSRVGCESMKTCWVLM